MTDYLYDPLDLVWADVLTEARMAHVETQYLYAKGRRFPCGGMADVGVKSASYVDVPGAQVVRLDDPCRVRLHVMLEANAGTAYAQLYDMTQDAAVAGSEVSTTETSGVLVVGDALDLDAGDYKLQVKNSSGSNVTLAWGANLVSQ